MKLAQAVLASVGSTALLAIVAAPSAFAFREETHPHMASHAANSMHNDSYNSDTHDFPGPVTQHTRLKRFQYSKAFGLCPTFAFDSKDHIVTLCVKALKTKLYVLEPENFGVLGSIELPRRKGVILAALTLQFQKMLQDTSGGAYFYLDPNDNIVVPTADRSVLFIDQNPVAGSEKVRLEVREKIDLKPFIPSTHCPKIGDADFDDERCDKLTSVLPDWQGRYWFSSRYGVVGVIDPVTGQTRTTRIPEQIQNSFSMSRDGAYIVSDTAMYRFNAGGDGEPVITWRETYDRGTHVKPGQINQGSGTTPTLFGGRYVAIGDNAEPRMNVLVYDRLAEDNRLICKIPVFGEHKSAVENSFVGYGNTLVVSNSYGYRNPFVKNDPAPGMIRIDVNPEKGACEIVWKNDSVYPVSATPKLSTANGLIYFYSRDRKSRFRRWQWFVAGVDLETGKQVYRRSTGKGIFYDNFWGTISPGPGNSVVVGALQGMMMLSDE
jgi:hypothetical protein